MTSGGRLLRWRAVPLSRRRANTALGRRIRVIEHQSSTIVGGQLKSFRPGAEGIKVEHDFRFRLSESVAT